MSGEAQDQHIKYVNSLREKIRELRGMLTESVCKECKCKQNTEVNMELVKRNLDLKNRLYDLNTRSS